MTMLNFAVFCSHGKPLLLRNFPCASCGQKVRARPNGNRLIEFPVTHAIQTGVCASCGDEHYVFIARNEHDCDLIRPHMLSMYEFIRNPPQMCGSSFDDIDEVEDKKIIG